MFGLGLGRPYERFLEERLAPGGAIIQVECTRDWRTRKGGDRAYFQFGCLGGVPEDEYHHTGERIARYLEQENSPVRSWEPPEMDARCPEAEWGWDPALGHEVAQVADRYGCQVRRLVSTGRRGHSPWEADLYRLWYRRLGRSANRLLVESYVQWDPMWVLRTGSVPFWSRFNSLAPALARLSWRRRFPVEGGAQPPGRRKPTGVRRWLELGDALFCEPSQFLED
jgi:hypothetical protein